MRVFVAGATGAIGTRLLPRLLAAGHDVTAMTRSEERAGSLTAAGVTPVVCDAFDREAVHGAVTAAAPEVVVHQLTSIPRSGILLCRRRPPGGRGSQTPAAPDRIGLTHATVVNNSAPSAANLSTGDLWPRASVVALPHGGGADCQVWRETHSHGYNFNGDRSCRLPNASDRSAGGDPGLGPLRFNGERTWTRTRLPDAASPLVDTIPQEHCVGEDQLRIARRGERSV